MICCNYACNKENSPAREDVAPAEPIELTVKQAEKANADNRFTFNIFKEVSVLEGANTFFSPLSLNMALGMLYNGASGDTRAEMAEVLGLADFTDAEINEYYQKMSQALLNIDPLTEISIANSIWYRDGFPVKQPFIDVNQKYFDAGVRSLDFSKPDAADIINKWCAEKTKDRIKEIIEDPIPGNVMMYLINALYFKSKWQFEFDKANTKQDDFTKAGNQKKKVPMMEQTTALPYYADQHLQCVEMPYGNQAFSMVAILPADNMSIEQLIENLDNTSWENIVASLREQNVRLKLPRFKIECDIPLNNPVKNVGMQQIFGGGFANISDVPLAVSNIKQKTFVEVNEEGTEAAAVTVIEMFTSSGPGTPSAPVPFFANRPFLYLIKEKSTGVILFIGRMDEPKE
jgi:serpin B